MAPFPRRVEAVVFDMDGLLVDTEVPFRDAMMASAAGFGRELPLEVFLRLVGGTLDQNRAILTAHFGEAFDLSRYFEDVRERALHLMIGGPCLKAGVLELLEHLEALGVPKAVCTSSGGEAVGRHLGGLVARFDAIVCRESVTRGKPHPEPYLKAAAALRTPPDRCLALEDSHNGVRAAHAAGMMTVMVPDLLEPTTEIRGLCVHVAADLHEVHRLVRASRGAAA
jgi:HAD superfamily hydrolase (TIGR01509 family)